MKIGDYLNTLATQSGIPADDADLKLFLSNVGISGAEIPDALISKIKILTPDSALNDSEINKKLRAKHLNAADSRIDALMDEHQFPDDVKAKIKAEPSTYEKITLYGKSLQDLESKKVQKVGGDKQKLADDIVELNKLLAAEKTGRATDLTKYNSEKEADFTNWELSRIYNGYKYALPTSQEASVLTAKTLVNDELAKMGLRIKKSGNNIELETSQGTEYFEPSTNKKVGVKDFIDSRLAHHKLLVVSEPEKKSQFPKTGENGLKSNSTSQKLDAMAEEAMKDLN